MVNPKGKRAGKSWVIFQGKKVPFCEYCEGERDPFHAYTEKCESYCRLCMKKGHTMLFCYKIKDCKLCGKSGHNPRRCWIYCTIYRWMERAEELGRCAECLTLFTTDVKNCTNCYTPRVYWKPPTPFFTGYNNNCKETQTETCDDKVQELQNELLLVNVNAQTIIDKQKSQIEELNFKISSLENKLEHSRKTMNELNCQLQASTKEKEKEIQRAKTLNSVCNKQDLELIDAKASTEKLQAEIKQKDLGLKQHNKIVNEQLPCPKLASNKLENTSELQQIKSSLKDLQAQQQQTAMMVNNLYYEDKIKTTDSTNYRTMNYLNSCMSFSYSPYMGLWDTGQNYYKLQQV